jgi:hypothetical protein
VAVGLADVTAHADAGRQGGPRDDVELIVPLGDATVPANRLGRREIDDRRLREVGVAMLRGPLGRAVECSSHEA